MRTQRTTEMNRSKNSLLLLSGIFLPLVICGMPVTGTGGELYQGAADAGTGAHTLDTVTVTASKMKTDIARTPTNIAVISREEIERHPSAATIFELLQQVNVPGVYLPVLPGSLPVDGQLSTRGSESTPWAVRILVNGIEFNKGNGYIVPPRIPTHDIERIEIVKTPSAVYGDQAIYGVINIITRRSDKPLEGKVGVSSDSFGSSNFHTVLNGQKNNWEYFLDIGMNRFNGFQDRAFEDDNMLYAQVRYYMNDISSLTFHASHFESDANYANNLSFEEFAADPSQNPGLDQPLEDNYDLYALVYDTSFGPHDLTIKTDFKDENTKMFWSGLYFEFDEWELHPELNLTLRHDLGSVRNTLVLGGEYRYHELDTMLFSAPDNLVGLQIGDRHREDTTYAAFLQDQAEITDQLTLTAGIRYDNYQQDQEGRVNASNTWSQSDSCFSPKLGMTYTVSQAVKLFSGFNSGFKSPVRVPGAAASGNLKPERINAYEFGLRGQALPWLHYETALFYHQVEDKIVSVARQQLENIGKTEARGLELSLNAQFDSGLYSKFGYTWQESEFKEHQINDVSYNGNMLPNVPEHIVGLTIGFRHSTWGDIAVSPTFHGDIYLNDSNTSKWDSYWLLGARYAKQFQSYPGMEFFVHGENLTDEQEVTQSGSTSSEVGSEAVYPVPGIRVSTGLRFTF
ncbi:MAG: TonB-dependent receptor [Candidatus Electrothrix scaldis]|nr:MAG: TonB-dependent receptor [Candidatus Electrothrix sp. GW3-3]